MSEGIESVGEVVTGGAMARAMEPEAGENAHKGSGACLNCGAGLAGEYCHRCGQAAHVHRTLGAFWHDLLHGVLHFEGKIWRTLPLLAWHPGELTRRYAEGERAKFVSPMALFLFSVFMMFAIFSTLGGPIGGAVTETPAEDRAEARREFEQERQEGLREIQTLRQERARLVQAGQPTTAIDERIRGAQRALEIQEDLYRGAMALINSEEQREAEAEAPEPAENAASNAASAAAEPNIVVLAGADSLNAWFDAAFKKARKNPSLLIYKIQTNAYKFSWALIPISVPFVWLLFLHRRRYREYKAYDHVVFVTYSITFMTLGLILLSLLRPLGLGPGAAISAMTFLPPIHMYRQLRGAYRLSRWSAAWRTLALMNFALIAMTLFLTLLLTLGVLG